MRLTLFLRDIGKVFVVAKGGQKSSSKLKAFYDIFTEAEFQIYINPHALHGRLTGGKLHRSHTGLSQSVEVFQMACQCCEVLEALVPFRAPSPELYRVLSETLHKLSNGHDREVVWVTYLTQLLKCLGHGDFSAEVHDQSVAAAREFVEGHLSQILPWKLKSDLIYNASPV
jgi:DNA repair protein RecO